MAQSERIHVQVAVALVTDQNQHVLLTLNENWGAFTLPMTRRHRGVQGYERPPRAALRAAVEVLGVPVRLMEEGPKRLMGRLLSERQLVDKIYTYSVYHVQPHPDFADRLQVRRPHLWLSPHLVLSGTYEPISESARFILRGVLNDFEIPTRVQRTSVLIIQRDDPERGRQFLVRWNPDWGYTLPAKRWDAPDSAKPEDQVAEALAGAARVARQELDLEPGTDVIITPAKSSEYITHGVSSAKDAPAFGSATDYVHSLFDAKLRHSEKLRSDRPLAWVTEDEVHHGWTAGSHGQPGAPEGRSGRVSRTTYEILLHLGLIAEVIDPELDVLARQWLEQHGGGLG